MKRTFVILVLVVAGRPFHANAQTETNLYPFGGSPTDGDYPQNTLVQGSDGNLYGTTLHGGTSTLHTKYGNGAAFRIRLNGAYANLRSFGSCPGDGLGPIAGLVKGSNGNFYGATLEGGTNNDVTVLRISTSGNETVLHSFAGFPDGAYPSAGLVEGSDGNFYGTTEFGATHGVGTVFRISPSANETVLHSLAPRPADPPPLGTVSKET